MENGFTKIKFWIVKWSRVTLLIWDKLQIHTVKRKKGGCRIISRVW